MLIPRQASHWLGIIIISLTSFGPDTSHATAYTDGFTWDRFTEFTTANNNNLDANGNPVWTYEWFTGFGTGADYTNTNLMGTVYNWTPPRWGQGNVNVSAWDQNTGFRDAYNPSQTVSLLRWTNPTGDGSNIDIDGNLTLFWGGTTGGAGWYTSAIDARFVAGIHDVSTDAITLLNDDLITAPFTGQNHYCGSSFGNCPNVTITLDHSVIIDAGDSFFWTVIPLGTASANNRWLTLNDNGMNIGYHIPVVAAVVPEPSAFLLLASGLLLLGRNRFKT